MASASRATARISSAEALFAMPYSGSRRVSAFFAGSSEGNGLSVMAIRGRGMEELLAMSLRGAKRRSNPERRVRTGLLRFARNDNRHNANTWGLTQFG